MYITTCDKTIYNIYIYKLCTERVNDVWQTRKDQRWWECGIGMMRWWYDVPLVRDVRVDGWIQETQGPKEKKCGDQKPVYTCVSIKMKYERKMFGKVIKWDLTLFQKWNEITNSDSKKSNEKRETMNCFSCCLSFLYTLYHVYIKSVLFCGCKFVYRSKEW